MPAGSLSSGRQGRLPLENSVELPQAGTTAATRSRLWLWFVAVFALQLAAWTAWFVVASKHKVAEVPLVTAPVR